MQLGAVLGLKETQMALLDPADHRSHRAGEQQPTTHPRLCLLAGFGFIVAAAFVVHYLFNALV